MCLTSDSSSSVERLAKIKCSPRSCYNLDDSRSSSNCITIIIIDICILKQKDSSTFLLLLICVDVVVFFFFFIILVSDRWRYRWIWVLWALGYDWQPFDAFVIIIRLMLLLLLLGNSLKKHTHKSNSTLFALSEMRSFCGWKGEYGFYFEINKSAHYSHSVCSGRQSVTIYFWIEAGETKCICSLSGNGYCYFVFSLQFIRL